MPLDNVFSPLFLQRVEISNRIVSSAHSTGLSDRGLIGDRLIAYYRARAAGGVGLIIVGTTSVHPTSVSRHQTALVSWDDTVIPTYRALADALAPFGTKAFVQLTHAGGLSGAPDGLKAVLAPSAVQTELGVDTPHTLTEDEIREVITAFAEAALRVREGELDGIELHAGHGNLLQQFLSPLTNHRGDTYGGSLEGRTRIAREVVESVRTAVGPDFPIGLRMSMEEDLPGGLDVTATLPILTDLIDAGDLDYVSVTTGSDTSSLSLPMHYAPMYVPTQHMRALAARVKAHVRIPVLVAGRVTDPRDADDIVRSGDADLVAMTRALIADPQLPNKAREGRFGEIRFCVGINDGCLGRLFRGLPVTCVQDPVSGRELELGPLQTADEARRVVVVGGGPAGLEAARVAALRGHHVTLLEASHELGGQIRLARLAPGRQEIGAIADQLATAARRAGVDIRASTSADVSQILDLRPDCVILATGSDPLLPPLSDDSARLVSTRDAYRTGTVLGDPLVVFDTQGDVDGLSTAEFLARRGFSVSLITTGWIPGWKVEAMTRRMLQDRLVEAGVRIQTRTDVLALTDAGIRVFDLVNHSESNLDGVATVVAACGARASDGLRAELETAVPEIEVVVVGDAYAPRRIDAAIYDGHLAGRAI